MLALGAAPAIVRAESLMRIVVPTRMPVFHPDVFSLSMPEYDTAFVTGVSGGRILTIEMITRETLKVLFDKPRLIADLNRQFEGNKLGDTIRIRRPPTRFERRT